MLRVTSPGRAEVESDAVPDGPALGAALDRAFQEDGVTSVGWWVPVGDWSARRTAWRLGFSYGGVLRGWVDPLGAARDAWAFTLRDDDPREPRTTWLEVPELQGDGVRLRALSEADLPQIVEGLGDPATQHWLAFMPRDPDESAARRYLQTATERLATNHTITWAFTAEDDLLLGVVGIYRLDGEPEVGYWTHPDARGRRLTTRAAGLVVRYAFEALGLKRIAAYVAAPNTGSLRVLESLGMSRTGVQRRAATTGDGASVDLVGYDLLAEELASPRR